MRLFMHTQTIRLNSPYTETDNMLIAQVFSLLRTEKLFGKVKHVSCVSVHVPENRKRSRIHSSVPSAEKHKTS